MVLGPAMRADLIIDMNGKPGGSYRVIDDFYQGLAYKLVDLDYASERPSNACTARKTRQRRSRGKPMTAPAKPGSTS